MNLTQWAARHAVSDDALDELKRQVFGMFPDAEVSGHSSEAEVQAHARLLASKRGDRLWRNNIGAGTLDSGSFVRFGLANDSATLNAQLKSSDLIGIEHGTGRFLSFECKRPGWRYTGTPREVAQLQWIGLVTSLGGRARFITNPEQMYLKWA